MVTMLLILITGCNGGGKINAPFTDEESTGMNCTDVMEQLATAGFTQITEEAVGTNDKDRDGEVVAVIIGDMKSYNTANKFKPDVPVIVKHYTLEQFEVTMEIVSSGDPECPTFSIKTNLPDKTELTVALTNGGSYAKTQTVKVKNGVATTERFFGDYNDLAGEYTVSCTMRIGEQGYWAKTELGSQGECMDGPLVMTDGETGERYVYLERPYATPVPEKPKKISEEELQTQFKTALSGFGDDYKISVDGYVYTVSVWQDGLAACAMLAEQGVPTAVEQWEEIVDTTAEASNSLQELLSISGYGDYMVQIEVLNDQNHENTLLTVLLGMVSYNCVS